MKTIQEAIDDLQTFLECDMPSKIFPKENSFGTAWERTDPFKDKEEVIKYLRGHFEILDKQIKEVQDK